MADATDILLVEDNKADARLIEIMLREANYGYQLNHVPTFEEGMNQVKEKDFSVILLDLSLPDSFGMDTIKNATKAAPNVPIIILTGRDDDEFAVDVVKAGAQDYLIKGQIESGLLSRAIQYAIQRKRLETNLQQKNNELLRVNKTLDRFVYTISHDFKKPVANVQGLLTLFDKEVEGKLSERGKAIYGKIHNSISDLKKMMEDLLESTKKESMQNQQFEEVKFEEVHDVIRESIEQLIQDSGATIHAKFSLPSILYSFQDLKSIMHNLLTNAIIYKHPDRAPEVWLESEKNFRGPCLIVRDNGRGMDLTQMGDRLFKKYQRFSTDVEGTGVGLWLVKETVEKNGGSIQVESTPGEGTTFKIFFNFAG